MCCCILGCRCRDDGDRGDPNSGEEKPSESPGTASLCSAVLLWVGETVSPATEATGLKKGSSHKLITCLSAFSTSL